MTILGRAGLDHPVLGATPKETVYAQIATIYSTISNDLSGRYFPVGPVSNSTSTILEHGFGVDLAECKVIIYTGSHPNLTRVDDYAASGWTVIATPGNLKTRITVTAPASGGPHTFAVWMVHGKGVEKTTELADVSTTAALDAQYMAFNIATGKWTPSFLYLKAENSAIVTQTLTPSIGRSLQVISGTPSDLAMIANPTNGKLLAILNQTGSDFNILHESGLTAANRIYTGTGVDFTLKDRAAVFALYSSDLLRWILIGGSSGSSSGSGVPNSLTNGDFEATGNGNTPAGWVAYNDGAVAIPVDGIGGTVNTDWTMLASSIAPLRGLKSAIITKTATNRQGHGWAFQFTMPAPDRLLKNQVAFEFDASANYVAGDFAIYLYDVTNSLLITPSISALHKATNGKFLATFDVNGGSVYRLILHCATTNSLAYTIKVDTFVVNAERAGYVPAIGEPIRYLPGFGAGLGGTTNEQFDYKQTTSSIRVVGQLTLGTTTGASAFMRLPNSWTSSNIGGSSNSKIVGQWWKNNANANTRKRGSMLCAPGTDQIFFCSDDYTAASAANVDISGTQLGSSGEIIYVDFTVNISQLAGSGLNFGPGAQVEYASNSSTSTTAADTTSFANGPAGSPIRQITAALSRRVRFNSAIGPNDRLEIQLSADGIVWLPISGWTNFPGVQNICEYQEQNAASYGIGYARVPGSSTDVDIRFGQYTAPNGATYGAAGAAYSATFGTYFIRMAKASPSSPVGFGKASATESGLVSAEDTGSFVVNFNQGMQTGTNNFTVNYSRVGRNVTLSFPLGAVTANVTSTLWGTLAGAIPAALRPSGIRGPSAVIAYAGKLETAAFLLESDGRITLYRQGEVAFTSGQSAAIYFSSMTYQL